MYIGWMDPQNIGMALGISLLSFVYMMRNTYLKLRGGHFGFSTSGDLLTCDQHQHNTCGMSAVAGNSNCVPNWCRNEDILHVIRRSQVLVTTSGFEPPIIDYLVDIRLILLQQSCSLVILSKSHQRVSLST